MRASSQKNSAEGSAPGGGTYTTLACGTRKRIGAAGGGGDNDADAEDGEDVDAEEVGVGEGWAFSRPSDDEDTVPVDFALVDEADDKLDALELEDGSVGT